MPEGHTIHRLAREQSRMFAGRVVRASSPQGRFVDGAAVLNGRVLTRTEAYGKHLFHRYAGGPILHVHLGLFGKFSAGTGKPPDPRGELRLRLSSTAAWTDLRGPTACELLDRPDLTALLARLGPDPLRRDADPDAAYARIVRSPTSVGALLMDQKVVAGIGNVYRAEVLYRHGVDPFLPGRELSEQSWAAMWADLVVLMRFGVRTGRIVTVRPEHRAGRRLLTREEAVYVYRRTGVPCRVCGTSIRTKVMAARNLFWCPVCQPAGAT
ncbi:MAG: Fpg/Nei family DNA glycosylase [Jatrophihabitans sp.]